MYNFSKIKLKKEKNPVSRVLWCDFYIRDNKIICTIWQERKVFNEFSGMEDIDFDVCFDDIEYIDGITVPERIGKWYTIDATIYKNKIYLLCENEQFADDDDFSWIILDDKGKFITESYDRFDILKDDFEI